MRDKAMKEIFLKQGFDRKVRRIVRLGLVRSDGNGGYWVDPLPGNKCTYHISRVNGLLTCQCDGFQTKAKRIIHPTCSHVRAVLMLFPQVNQGNLFIDQD